MSDQEDLASVLNQSSWQLLRAVYSDRTFEIREPLLLGDQDFGSIRIGVSTLLVKHELREALRTASSDPSSWRCSFPPWWPCSWRSGCCGRST